MNVYEKYYMYYIKKGSLKREPMKGGIYNPITTIIEVRF